MCCEQDLLLSQCWFLQYVFWPNLRPRRVLSLDQSAADSCERSEDFDVAGLYFSPLGTLKDKNAEIDGSKGDYNQVRI